MKVHLYPSFEGADAGDGGIRRVCEGQIATLPTVGWEIEKDPAVADVIACHITVPATYVKLYPRTPLVAHIHGLYWAEYEWERWSYRANADVMEACRIADAITAPTEWVAQSIRRHTSRPVHVIPHGINLDEWEPLGDEGACRCAEALGENSTMEIAGITVAVHLEVCPGSNPSGYVLWNKTRPDPVCDPQAVMTLAAMMPDVPFRSTFGNDALGNVAVTGKLPFEQAKVEVRRAGVYLATTRETFGVGTLEALACGVPVVGWRWGGQAEFIEHGVDGWLATPGDFEDLAKGVRWALEGRKTDRASQVAACRSKAALFTWERAAAMYAEVYADVVEKYRRHGPKVSVIVRAYNAEATIGETLSSLKAQTMPDFEVVVVDDVSSDQTGAIADAYAGEDPRFRVIHAKQALYLAGGHNAGIAAARGEYIIALDADDMFTPGTLKVLSDALDEDRTIHIAYGSVDFLTDGKHWHSGWPVPFDIDLLWKGPGQLGPYSSMYRREVLELLGGYRDRCRSSEDQDMAVRAASYGFRPKMVTNEDTLIYRVLEDSATHVEGWQEQRQWFPWAHGDTEGAPAGACTKDQLAVHSCDPPLVSVIIPVGPGHEHLVINAVDSVDAQTFRQWECIVINDTGGELPRLPSWVLVLEPMHDPPIPPPLFGTIERYGGVAAARNAGIRASKAKLFLPLDADDLLEPRCIELMLQAHEQTGDIIYSEFWENPSDAMSFRVFKCDPWDPTKLLFKGAISTVTQLTPKTVWEEVGGYDETLHGWEDWAFQIAYAEKGHCAKLIPHPLFTYRKNTGTRAGQNVADYEQSKQGIIDKFGGRYWDGTGVAKEELMACRTCGGGGTIEPIPFQRAAMSSGDMAEFEYIGGKGGQRHYRSVVPGFAGYSVDAADGPFYVLAADIEMFAARPAEFRRIERGEGPPIEDPAEPILNAERPVVMRSAPEVVAAPKVRKTSAKRKVITK